MTSLIYSIELVSQLFVPVSLIILISFGMFQDFMCRRIDRRLKDRMPKHLEPRARRILYLGAITWWHKKDPNLESMRLVRNFTPLWIIVTARSLVVACLLVIIVGAFGVFFELIERWALVDLGQGVFGKELEGDLGLASVVQAEVFNHLGRTFHLPWPDMIWTLTLDGMLAVAIFRVLHKILGRKNPYST